MKYMLGVLREWKGELGCPLTMLFNRSTTSGVVPKAWKLADEVIVLGRGKGIWKSNCGPVSLMTTVGKAIVNHGQ